MLELTLVEALSGPRELTPKADRMIQEMAYFVKERLPNFKQKFDRDFEKGIKIYKQII